MSWWSVNLPVARSEAGPMSRDEALGALFIDDVRRLTIGLTDDLDGGSTFTIELRADSADNAEAYAQTLLERVRHAAGFEAQDSPEVRWVAPIADGEVSSHRFLEQARELRDSEQFELAIVAAQIHFEIQLLTLLDRAVREDSPRWAQRLIKERSAANLRNEVSKATVHLLLGVDITQVQPQWQAFDAHLQRRNRIVHGGAVATEEEATASIEVVTALWLTLVDAARANGGS